MHILVVAPERRPEVREIEGSLEAMQNIVGGLIQPIYLDDSVALICNDEGKLLDLPANRGLRDKNGQLCDIVCGTFFLCNAPPDCDHLTSLTPEQISSIGNASTPRRCFGAWMAVSSVCHWRSIEQRNLRGNPDHKGFPQTLSTDGKGLTKHEGFAAYDTGGAGICGTAA